MIAELRTFIAVARQSTFSAAGERVGLTQAAVSGQIKRLEEKLGFSLFDRTGRSATLNAAGARTLARAQEIVSLFDALGDADDERIGGRIRLGAIASVQSTVLARALTSFRRRFPKPHVHIVPGLSLHLLDRLDAGELDLAIMIPPPFGLPSDLSWQPLIREPFELVVPATGAGDDWRSLLRSRPFLRYDRASFGGRQVERFLRAERISVAESIEVDDVQAMVAMVGSGLGVALVPMAEAHLPLPANVRAIPLGEHGFHREIGIARHHHRDIAPGVEHLARCLTLAAGPRGNGGQDRRAER
ncbi:LysR substrate-binding domain-containing protein [Muricoccus pecuniae]|uniref:DNA-binding transcriptional LysR family regulator n=1 Tax=Muricoccus pecuniae TaxID=693023 RepID=A0A840YHG4_9PROT|nr:LysR substrate-binding domain-containing protein [Roseomonas pecuniae]MBB5695821.1 DNA-binding transcriptional LysR family regulator [Roseomonas pecuniae]